MRFSAGETVPPLGAWVQLLTSFPSPGHSTELTSAVVDNHQQELSFHVHTAGFAPQDPSTLAKQPTSDQNSRETGANLTDGGLHPMGKYSRLFDNPDSVEESQGPHWYPTLTYSPSASPSIFSLHVGIKKVLVTPRHSGTRL